MSEKRPYFGELEDWNVLGQRLAQEHAWLAPGQAWELRWPTAAELSSGVYLMQASNGQTRVTRTVTRIR